MKTLYKLHNIASINTTDAAKRKLYKHYNAQHKGMVGWFTPHRTSYTTGYRCSMCHSTVEA